MKIGIFGGSFDPVHNGHISICDEAINRFGLDFAYVVPAETQPFKADQKVTPLIHRYAMLVLATMNEPKLIPALYDQGMSYTYRTLERVRKDHPNDELFFIMGMDSYQSLPKWSNVHIICDLANIIVANRPNYNKVEVANEIFEKWKRKPRTLFMDDVELAIASTNIRENIKNGGYVNRFALNAKVADYIKKQKLYTE